MHSTTAFGKDYGLKITGHGSTETVYQGYDPFSDRDVAIKLSRQPIGREDARPTRKLFYNEAQSARSLVHPGIVRLLDAGEESGAPYLVMEYVGGGKTLRRHCRPDTLLPIENAAQVTYHCAKALDYSHRNGVIHRDVKPSNVLLCADGSAKITDFGIAQTQSSDATQIAGVVGSPRYMSPEQILEQNLTAATDIYSLGVVMLELLTGSTPFSGTSLCSLMHSIINDEPRLEATENHRSGTITAALDVVQQALRKNPGDRFSSADVFASALCDVFNITPVSDDNMSLQQQREALTELTFFSEFSPTQIDEVAKQATWRRYATNETIILEGNLDLSFYIIALGQVGSG